MLSDARRDRLDAWVRAVAPRAVAYAASLLNDRAQAEDVVQDCFYRLLSKADAYDLERDGAKLLFTAISNAAINDNTRRRSLVSLQASSDQDRDLDPVDLHAPAPDQTLMIHELQDAIAEGLARLPLLHRAALELRSLGHGKNDIAEVLGISPSHAGVLVHRARQQLGEFLAPYLGEVPS